MVAFAPSAICFPAMPQPTPLPEPAHFSRRCMAMLYDGFLLFAVEAFAAALLSWYLGTVPEDGNPAYFAFLLTIAFAFYGGFWTTGGQTLGMKTWRLRLETKDGGPVRFRTALLRFVAALFSWLPLGLGFIWMLWDKQRRTWHDMASGTRIVRLPKA